MIMVYSVLLLAIATVGYAEQRTALYPAEKVGQFLGIFTNCISEAGVTEDSLIKLKEVKLSDDKNFNKYLYCVLVTSGYSDKDGHVTEEKTVELFPESDRKIVKEVIEECNKNQGIEAADAALAFYKCFIEKSPVVLVIRQ